MNYILTRFRAASSKADVFEAKIASAVDEADTSDSDETFVYDSNPPDGRDRPQRFHSRTPSATSMASQVDRNGMRSIHQVLDGPAGAAVAVKKNMKFVNNFSSGNDSGIGDDEASKGSGRSNGGSSRGTTRQQYHLGRFGRTVPRDGHPSLFDNESPFLLNTAARPRPGANSTNPRQPSGPPSPASTRPRERLTDDAGGVLAPSAYDLDDTTGADDERTPLIQSSVRSGRAARGRRHPEPRAAGLPPAAAVLPQPPRHVPGGHGHDHARHLRRHRLHVRHVAAAEPHRARQHHQRDCERAGAHVRHDHPGPQPQHRRRHRRRRRHGRFAKSPHAGTDSEWWRRPHGDGTLAARADASIPEVPKNDTAPNMLLGHIFEFDSPLSFEGSFFHNGLSPSTAAVRIRRPGNETDGGSERWERIMADEFTLIVKGSLKYSLPSATACAAP